LSAIRAEDLLVYFGEGFMPPDRPQVSEWAEANRVLTRKESPFPGAWNNDRTPFLVEPMDCLSMDSPIRVVIFMKGGQIGGSEIGNNWVGYLMAEPAAHGPILMVLPTDQMARRTRRQRLEPMMKLPCVARWIAPKKSRDGGNTQALTEFGSDGILGMAGANSSAGLSQFSARYLFPDEPDRYPEDVDGEGDPMDLIEGRASAYAAQSKMFVPCTPTIDGASRIQGLFKNTDQRRYFVPCLRCGDYDIISWKRLKWEKGKPETVRLVCLKCEHGHTERDKPELLRIGNAEWRQTKEGCPPDVRGYHLPQLYAPLGMRTWEAQVRQFLEANEHADRRRKLKTWTNLVLGEVWKEEGTGADWEKLFARREQFPTDVPMKALVILAGVDVQDDRLEATAWAFGRGEESWAIETRVFFGDPDTSAPWEQLDDWLGSSYQHESGQPMEITGCCVDANYKTDTVYRWVSARSHRRVWAIQGRGGEGRPLVAAPVTRKRAGAPGVEAVVVPLFIVGSDTCKGLIYARLNLTEKGPGYIHVPVRPGFDEEWAQQVCGEVCEPHIHQGRLRRVWKPTRARVEGLDCFQYALAALYILSPVWDALAETYHDEPTPQEPEKGPRLSPGFQSAVRRRPTNWINDWKRKKS